MAYYGPHTAEVVAVIERLKTLTNEEAKALDSAWIASLPRDRYTEYAATEALWESSQEEYWDAARADALETSQRSAWDFLWFDPREVALSAILAIIARDHITPEQYDELYGPWASVMVVEGRKAMTGKYGSRTQEVEAVIERLKAMTYVEAQVLQEACEELFLPSQRHSAGLAAERAVMQSAQKDNWEAAQRDVLNYIHNEAKWYCSRPDVVDAVLGFILTLFAGDLITPEQYALLYTPWASVMA